METTITKRLQSDKMVKIFESTDLINIRYFSARNFKGADFKEDNTYTYDIVVRHNEDEDALSLFNNALKLFLL